jgi:chromate reductase, NAD(P)H dehydrogenase (quinone)
MNSTSSSPTGRSTVVDAPRDIKFLVFSASLRSESLNTRLATLAARVIVAEGGEVDLAPMSHFNTASFNADLEPDDSPPVGAIELRRRLEACDAFVIASPEYNASMPGLLKNTIDWVSRFQPQPFNERHGLLMSASPSMMGGNRGLWSLRVPFEHLGARIYPDMFSLAQAHKAFADDGRLVDRELQGRFESNVTSFMSLVEASKHYPCARNAWVEYLGERLDTDLERVE